MISRRRYCYDHEIEAFEKMTLSISILISQTVFLSLLAKRIPETSLDIPLLGGYLLFTMSMVSVRVVQDNLSSQKAFTFPPTEYLYGIILRRVPS